MTAVAHAGYLVDDRTGEVLRQLDTARRCLDCGVKVERQGASGNHPLRCGTCGAARERAKNAARMARLRAARDAKAHAYGWSVVAVGSPLIWDARRDSEYARPSHKDRRHAEVMDALGVRSGEEAPLVVDRYIDAETGKPRTAKPRDWYTNAGPGEVWSTKYPDLAGELHRRRRDAVKDPWFVEHPRWRGVLDDDQGDNLDDDQGDNLDDNLSNGLVDPCGRTDIRDEQAA